MGWVLLGFFAWQFRHFQRQNLGIVALAAMSHGVAVPTASERRVLALAGWAGIAGLLTRPALLGLRADPGLAPAFRLAFVGFAAAGVAGIALLARRPSDQRPVAYRAAYGVGLLFSLPIFLFRSPYAAVGGMTAAHGLQYLLLAGLTAEGGRRRSGRTARILVMGNFAVFAGAGLAAASHLHDAAAVGRFGFGAYLGVVMAHFVVDAGIWRLRDPFPRHLLARRIPFLVPAGVPRALTPNGMGPPLYRQPV